MRYSQAGLATAGIVMAFVASAVAVLVAVMKYRTVKPSRSALSMAICLPLCFFTAFVLGDEYWRHKMIQVHIWNDMAVYVNIDPDRDRGQSFMDAGTLYFKEGSSILRNNTIAFRNGRTYCVAPIVRPPVDREVGSEVLQTASGFVLPRSGTVDFWAVGVDCCDGGKEFSCGDAHSRMARSGMRALDETNRAMYLLGVQEWSAMNGLPVHHPLFFTWVRDPIEVAKKLEKNCSRDYLARVITCFFAMLVAAYCCHAALKKMHIQ